MLTILLCINDTFLSILEAGLDTVLHHIIKMLEKYPVIDSKMVDFQNYYGIALLLGVTNCCINSCIIEFDTILSTCVYQESFLVSLMVK